MEKQHIFLLIILSLFLVTPIADAKDDCSPVSCGPNQPEIRFPFRILFRQPAHCGFPGFDLSCDQQNQTIIRLPLSLSYIVNKISYAEQIIYIDPGFCQPNRIVTVNISDSPFSSPLWMQSYTFFNCSSLQNYSFKNSDMPFLCLSTGNYSVIAVQTGSLYPGHMPATTCEFMNKIRVPVRFNSDIREELQLMWYTPYCRSCEMKGQTCRLESHNGLETTICVSSSRRKGILRSTKYGLSIGIGVPALIGIIGLVCYASSREQGRSDSNNQGIDLSSLATIRQPASTMGLDGPTIESFPKTVFEDSCSLPTDDRTCAICLSDYKPKESLRTIPECNHYFHAECIDEWLKLNATCPVCRKTPRNPVLVTSCSKASSSTSIDSS